MPLAQLISVSRPRFWIYIIGPILIAWAAAGLPIDVRLLLVTLYATLPANLLIYGFNDIFDRETDRLNPKKAGYEHTLADNAVIKLLVWILLLNVPVLVALVFLLPLQALPWLVLFLIAGIGYSVPPLRMKTKPFLDALSNVLYVCLGFMVFTMLTGGHAAWHIILAATCWCAAMHAYSAVPDIKADRGARLQTIATVLGKNVTLFLCGLLYIASGLLSHSALSWFSFVAIAIYSLMIILSIASKSPAGLLRIYKAFPFVNAATGMLLWFYIVLQ